MFGTVKKKIQSRETAANLCLGAFAVPLILMVGSVELRQRELPALFLVAVGVALLLRRAVANADERTLGLIMQLLLAWATVRLVSESELGSGSQLLLVAPVLGAFLCILPPYSAPRDRTQLVIPLGLAAFAALALLPLLDTGDSPFTVIPSYDASRFLGGIAGAVSCWVAAASVRGIGFSSGRRLATSVLITLIVAVSMGGIRAAWMMVTLEDAMGALEQGRLEDAERLATRVHEMNARIENPEADPEPLSRRFLAHASSNVHSLTTVARIAESLGQWPVSVEAYASALQLQPEDPELRLAMSWGLFRAGDRTRALAAVGMISDPEFVARKAVVMARAGQLAPAAALLPTRPDLDGGTESGPMSDVLGATTADVIHELGPYPGIEVLRRLGWAVFHDGSLIGQTGRRSPVDIRAVSGGGELGWQVERIIIDGAQTSRMGRGYNVIALIPSTGEVLQRHQFDTRFLWGLGEGRALADTLAALPEGVIIIGTANHGARHGLPRRAWFELQGIGVRELPSNWGSHAFIGIKGAGAPGEEDLCDIGMAHVGVVAPNIDPDVTRDPHRLETFLRSKATKAKGGVAVYLAGYHRGDMVTISVASQR